MQTFHETTAENFHAAVSHACLQRRNGRLVGETVYAYPLDQYREMRCFLSPDSLTGYGIKRDGDLISVFNVGAKGAGQDAVRDAIRNGATRLDAYDEDGYLPSLYASLGFVEHYREPWNPVYAPPGWAGGTPDVVYMHLPPTAIEAA